MAFLDVHRGHSWVENVPVLSTTRPQRGSWAVKNRQEAERRELKKLRAFQQKCNSTFSIPQDEFPVCNASFSRLR